jgi:DNA (cytosine-5)-methyltransferase 1
MLRSVKRALDLFCCAGGATKGLQQAGYHVSGVDIVKHDNYPGDAFYHTSVLSLSQSDLRMFDLIWASPPCQSFCAYRRKDPTKIGASYPNLIPQTRALLKAAGVPYIIENVPGAPLENPITLCGSMFGLDVRRHRIFETSFYVDAPSCQHQLQQGNYPQATNRANRRKTCEIGVWRIPLATQHHAMGGCEWMTLEQLSEAIPPAYAEWLGRRAL